MLQELACIPMRLLIHRSARNYPKKRRGSRYAAAPSLSRVSPIPRQNNVAYYLATSRGRGQERGLRTLHEQHAIDRNTAGPALHSCALDGLFMCGIMILCCLALSERGC